VAEGQLGTRDCSRRACRDARRFRIRAMGLIRKLLSSSRRIWGAEFSCGNNRFAFCRRAADRSYIRYPLPERCTWLRLVDVLGPGIRYLLVVSWSAYAIPDRGASAAGLVRGTGQRPVWVSCLPPLVWSDARCHL